MEALGELADADDQLVAFVFLGEGGNSAECGRQCGRGDDGTKFQGTTPLVQTRRPF